MAAAQAPLQDSGRAFSRGYKNDNLLGPATYALYL